MPADSVIIVPEIGQKHWEMALCGLSSRLISVPWVELSGINVPRVDACNSTVVSVCCGIILPPRLGNTSKSITNSINHQFDPAKRDRTDGQIATSRAIWSRLIWYYILANPYAEAANRALQYLLTAAQCIVFGGAYEP